MSIDEHTRPSGSVLVELLAEAHRIKDERCAAFPHLICNETPGLAFDNWCDPCKARHIVVWEKAQSAEMKANTMLVSRRGPPFPNHDHGCDYCAVCPSAIASGHCARGEQAGYDRCGTDRMQGETKP